MIEEVEIRHSKLKILKYLFITIVFFIVSIHMLLYVIDHYNEVGYQSTKLLRYKNFSIFISVVGALLSGGGVIGFIYMLFKCGRLLTIDTSGININSLCSESTFISWGEIKSIMERKLGNQRFIRIEVNDLSKFINKQPSVKRKIMRATIACGHLPVIINLNLSKVDIDDVISMMNNYWEEWKDNYKLSLPSGEGS